MTYRMYGITSKTKMTFLSQTIGKDVQELVLKEMNYLMREQDEAQEERYRKLDAAIRGSRKKKGLFRKEKKEKTKPVN